jgi:hypothetical protein
MKRVLVCLALVVVVAALDAGVASASAPKIESVSASKVGERKATLTASILAGGLPTRYEVFVEYARCQGGAGECANPPKKEEVASGKVKEGHKLKQKVNRLTPSCSYVFWFVASNADGRAESAHDSFTARGGTSGPKECSR